MAEILNVRHIKTGQDHVVSDVNPVESAKLFKQISDEIWRQKPDRLRLASFSIPSALPTLEARDALNEALDDIDKELVVSGIGKAIKLGGFWPDEEVELNPELLDNPAGADVGTFNWDERNTWRFADIEGKKEPVEFTDGHKDFHRELYAGFSYLDERRQTVQLTYSMQRIQSSQDRTTSLTKTIWHSQFAETGYEGSQLQRVPVSVEQEIRVLNVFQAIGGISLRATQL